MNVVILCDSKFGNTQRLAEAMRNALSEGNTVHVRPAADGLADTTGIDVLLVGGPTQAHGASQPLKEALSGRSGSPAGRPTLAAGCGPP